MTWAKSPRNAAQGTTILRVTSQSKLAYTVQRLPAVEAIPAVLDAADKAMLVALHGCSQGNSYGQD